MKSFFSKIDLDNNWWRAGIVVIVTPVVYCLFFFILAISISHNDVASWLKHLIILFLSLLFLGVIGAALKKSKQESLATAMAIGIFFLFFLCMAYIYLGKVQQHMDGNNVPAQVAAQVIPISTKGSFPMRLSQGQTSDWIDVDPALSYKFSNPNSTFYLTYEDGSIAKSWGLGNWPKKYKFKVTSLSNEQFNLITE
jgi:hypothetical protein